MEKEWNELRLSEARGYGDSYKADPPSKKQGRLKRGRPARRKWDMVHLIPLSRISFLFRAPSYTTHMPPLPKVPDYDDEDEGYEFDVVRALTPQVV